MSGELKKPPTLMRLRRWLGRLLANVSARWNSGIAKHAWRTGIMNVNIQKLNGLWHLIVGSCQIRTPFLEAQDRALVVAYARRVYPGARIFERD
jgi:hypothetical protein